MEWYQQIPHWDSNKFHDQQTVYIDRSHESLQILSSCKFGDIFSAIANFRRDSSPPVGSGKCKYAWPTKIMTGCHHPLAYQNLINSLDFQANQTTHWKQNNSPCACTTSSPGACPMFFTVTSTHAAAWHPSLICWGSENLSLKQISPRANDVQYGNVSLKQIPRSTSPYSESQSDYMKNLDQCRTSSFYHHWRPISPRWHIRWAAQSLWTSIRAQREKQPLQVNFTQGCQWFGASTP